MTTQGVASKDFDQIDRHMISARCCARVSVLVVCTVLCVVILAESMHFNHFMNLVRYGSGKKNNEICMVSCTFSGPGHRELLYIHVLRVTGTRS